MHRKSLIIPPLPPPPSWPVSLTPWPQWPVSWTSLPRRRDRTLSSARLVGTHHQLPSSSLHYLLRRRGLSARHRGRSGLSAGPRCRGGANGPSRRHVSSARIISFPRHPSATSSAVVACQLDTVATVACQLDLVAAAARAGWRFPPFPSPVSPAPAPALLLLLLSRPRV